MIQARGRPRPPSQSLIAITLGALLMVLTAFSAHAAAAAPPPGTEFRPAPHSTLVTRADLAFVVARWQDEARTTTVLALRQSGAEPRPVARLQQERQGADLLLAVQILAAANDTADIELAALEHLFGLVFRQQPLALHCLGDGPAPCDAAQDRRSHASLLQELAARRAQAAARAASPPGAVKPVPWRLVELQGLASRAGDVDTVSVRATGAAGPIERLALYFDRAPHSICTARTDTDGVATCRLEDQHGDGSQHDHATTVVAAFPGEVRPDRVLLPTTMVLPIAAGPALPAFVRPLTLPGSRPVAPSAPATSRP